VSCALNRMQPQLCQRGADIVLGRTDLDLCPVAAVLSYTACRGNQPGPFFITSAKLPLTKPEFVREFRKVLDALGLPVQQYAGHSFHIGAAAIAALAGMEDSAIQLLGQWQSMAFLCYIRTPHERLASFSLTLASQDQPASTSSSPLGRPRNH